MKIDGVIFDMDGLMLDTETLGLEIFRKVIAELGVDPLDEVYFSTVGRTWADTRHLFLETGGATFPFDEMVERWRRYYYDHLSEFGAPYKTGLITLLNGIQALGLPTAVATSTSRKSALTLLAKVDLLHRFTAIACGDEVQHSKPHPDIFLLAAARLNVAPQHCIVFEDSAPGLRGAAAAGMWPILVPDLIPPTPAMLELAHRVCKSLDEACDLFHE